MSLLDRQLSFDVVPRPRTNLRGETVPTEILGAELKLKGELRIPVNLEHGDALLVTVTGPDGEVLARQEAEVSAPPTFAPIEEKDLGLIGYARVHTAKIGDPLA